MPERSQAESRARDRERATAVVAAALAVVSRSPDRAGRGLATAFGKVAKSKQQQMIAEWLKDYLAPDTPGAEYVRRLMRQLHPNVRKRFLAGFISSLFFRDPEISERLKREKGINAPNLIAISPSMRCNLRCRGCFTGNYSRQDDLPEEVVERVVCEAEAIGTNVFIFIGGEPFMWPPFLDLVERHPQSFFQPYTNATLITDEIADRIVKLGNVAPSISIEGWQERTDARRGSGTYDKVIGTMERLRDRGAMFSFSATVTRENLDEVTSDAFVDFMIEKGALYGWYFAYMPVGLNPDLSYMPTPKERNRLRSEVVRLRREKPILLADFWGDGTLTGGCLSAGRKYLHITNKGDVEPCVFAHFAVDNIKNTTLVDALCSPFFQELRRMQPFGHNLLRPCPLIDHPGVIRHAVEKHHAYPTHEGATSLITDLQPGLKQYASQLRDELSPVWQTEYKWAEDWLSADKDWHRRHSSGVEADDEVDTEQHVTETVQTSARK